MSVKYRVVVDGVDIYDEEQDMQLISPTLELSLGAAGTFDFTLPPRHVFFDRVRLLLSTIDVYDGNTRIWSGRPTSVETDFFNQRTYKCEGAMSYMNDSVFRRNKGKFPLNDMLRMIISAHNSQVAQNRQLQWGVVTMSDIAQQAYVTETGQIIDTLDRSTGQVYDMPYFDYDTMSCYEAINNILVGRFGGYVNMRYTNIGIFVDWVKDVGDIPGNSSGPVIQYSFNLKDAKQTFDISDYVTQVLPYGKECATPTKTEVAGADWDSWKEENEDAEYTTEFIYNKKGNIKKIIVTEWGEDDYPRPDNYDKSGESCSIKAVNNGNDIIRSAAADIYGPITKVVTFSDIDDRNILYAKGVSYLMDQQFDRLTIECTAADFNDVSGVPFPTIQLGMYCHVISTPHLIDRVFPVSKISYDLNSGTKDITLGTQPKQTLTEFTATNANEIEITKYEASKSSSSSSSNKNNVNTNAASGNYGGTGGDDGWAHVLCTMSEYVNGSKNPNTIYLIYG